MQQNSNILVWDVKSQVRAKGEICEQHQPQTSGLYIFQWIWIPQVSGAINLLSQQNSWGLISGGDFTRRSCPRSQNIFCYHKQDYHSEMQQCNSKGTCSIANTSAMFLGSTGMYFRGYTSTLREGKSTARYSVATPVVAELYWKQLYSSEYLKNILQNFFFVVIGGDTYNKIFALPDEEEKLRIRFFTSWNGFLKVPIKFRCLWKLLLNKSFPLSVPQKNSPLKESQKITTPSVCPKGWSAIPMSFWGLFVYFILKMG